MAKKPIPKESDEIDIEEMLEEEEDDEEEVEVEVKPKPKPKAKPKVKSKAKPKVKPKPKPEEKPEEKPDSLVIRSRVYRFVRKRENVLKVSRTTFPKLNEILEDIIEKGCQRAEANNRKTLHAKDI